jgi:nucleotide-binding universal stress UspA family protein
MAINRVLVPVDGSSGSMRALEHAAKRSRGSRNVCLLLLNVQPTMPPSRFVRPAMIRDHHLRMSEEALAPARKLCERLDIEFQCYVREGEPAQLIATFARRTRCTEIVMGTRGLGRISGLVLGSVATKVIHLATVPVTLVK